MASVPVKEITIEDFSLDIPSVSKNLEKIRFNYAYKMMVTLFNIFYSFIILLISNQFPKSESSPLLAIVLNLLFYLTLSKTLTIQTKILSDKIETLEGYQEYKCQSITINIMPNLTYLNLKDIILEDTQFNNSWIYFTGFSLLVLYFFIEITIKSKLINGFLIVLVFTGHIVLLLVFCIIELIDYFILKKVKTFQSDDSVASTPPRLGLPRNRTEDSRKRKMVAKIDSDCSICLSQFQQEECITLFFCCKNTFHTDCIDLWLDKNTTCPLCREIIY